MQDPIDKNDKVVFGDFIYLPEVRQIRKKAEDQPDLIGEEIKLDKLSLDALIYFIENAGKLINKDELLKDVWNVQGVTDSRVFKAISVIREALGDNVKESSYIETRSKQGYIFVATVSKLNPKEKEPPTPEPEPEPEPELQQEVAQQKKINKKNLTLVSAMFVSVVASIMTLGVTTEKHQIKYGTWESITSLKGFEYYLAVSADKQFMSYSHSNETEPSQIFVRDVYSNEVRQLTDSKESNYGSGWSPDGKHLAYSRLQPNALCEIRMITFDGDPIKSTLKDEKLTDCNVRSIASRITWSGDGNQILFSSAQNDNEANALYAYNFRNQTKKLFLTPTNSGIGDFAPKYSPDGDKIAFLRDVAMNSVQVMITSSDGGETEMLYHITDGYPASISWSNNGDGIFYVSNKAIVNKIDTGTGQITPTYISNSRVYELHHIENNDFYGSVGIYGNYMIQKLNNPIVNTVSSKEQLFSSSKNERMIKMSPSGNGPFASISTRTSIPQIWLFYPNGDEKPLTDFSEVKTISDTLFVSDDSTKVAAVVDQEVWLYDLNAPPSKISKPNEIVNNISWDQKNNVLYYSANEKGFWKVFAYEINTKSYQVHLEDVDFFETSRDAEYTFYHNDERSEFILEHDRSKRVINDRFPEYDIVESVAFGKQGFYFAAVGKSGKSEIYHTDYNASKITPLNIEAASMTSSFEISEDDMFIYRTKSSLQDIDISRFKLLNQFVESQS